MEQTTQKLSERSSSHSKTSRKRKCTRGCRGGKKKAPKTVLGKGIYNLSDTQFTTEEMKILDLGLKYAPGKPSDQFEVYIDLQKFLRNVNLQKIFHDYHRRADGYSNGI